MIKAEVLDAMLSAGCTAEQIVAAVKASMTRSTGAERQARYRARKAHESVTSDVTLRNSDASDASDDVSPSPLCPPDKESSPTPPKEINPPISPQPLGSVAAQKRREDEEWFDEAVRYDYPRKTPRLPALKAWMRLSAADKAKCARAVTEYSIRFDDIVAKSKRSRDEELQYVPHLSTFINQRRWEEIDETA